MVPVEVAGSKKIPGKGLMSVTLRLKDPKEIEIYKSFLKDEPSMKVCPHCGSTNVLGENNLCMDIDNPLVPAFLMLAKPNIKCESCGAEIEVSSCPDYSAFPSVLMFLKSLRVRNNQIKSQAKGG